MARRMYSIDQISGGHDMTLTAGNGININQDASAATISLSLYQHNVHLSSFDNSMNAYITVYSVNSAPVTTKQELIDNLLLSMYMSATGTAENNMKIIYAIYQSGQILYTDMAGNEGLYSDDYNVEDQVVAIGG